MTRRDMAASVYISESSVVIQIHRLYVTVVTDGPLGSQKAHDEFLQVVRRTDKCRELDIIYIDCQREFFSNRIIRLFECPAVISDDFPFRSHVQNNALL